MTFIVDGTSGLTFPNSTVQASAGQVLQIVNASTSSAVSTTSSAFTATGLTASITPKFSTSKILIFVSQQGIVSRAASAGIGVNLYRNSTNIDSFAVVAAFVTATGVTGVGGVAASTTYLDSPATVSSVTYSTKFNSNDNATNVSVQNNNDTSTITLMEIAG
jgi:hypothetical protein